MMEAAATLAVAAALSARRRGMGDAMAGWQPCGRWLPPATVTPSARLGLIPVGKFMVIDI